MLDHPFFGVVAQLRETTAAAFLQLGNEESLTSDLLSGSLAYEATFLLPGETVPLRQLVEVSLDWPTWSQTSWRAEATGEFSEEAQELIVVVTFRLLGLSRPPDATRVLAALPADADFGGQALRRTNLLVEHSHHVTGEVVDITAELNYEEMVDVPADGFDLQGFGPWLASVLVRMGDLKLEFRPPEEVLDE
jgi:hypothetical protein